MLVPVFFFNAVTLMSEGNIALHLELAGLFPASSPLAFIPEDIS